jgi:hypothetical protein
MASSTGTGAVVLATSPTITTPTINTITSPAGSALALQSAGTTAIYVDTSQNVGINATPTAQLQVFVQDSVSGKAIRAAYNGTYYCDYTETALNCYNNNYTINVKGGSNLIFKTTDTERMRIDSSGRITTPYQPYCLVTPPASFTVSANTEVIVNGTWAASTNIGSNFATSGGIFTAPIAGVYQIEWTVFFNASAANRMDVFIYLNGSIIARKEQQKWATNSNNNSSQITATLLLAASDQIKFGVFSSSATTLFSTGQPWQYASVILLG